VETGILNLHCMQISESSTGITDNLFKSFLVYIIGHTFVRSWEYRDIKTTPGLLLMNNNNNNNNNMNKQLNISV